MLSLVGNTTGLIHLLVSLVALVTGTLVLSLGKGTLWHRRVGYCYLASMTVMLITAFMIYRLFGRFGLFHGLALLSTFSLVAGMYPILTRKSPNYVFEHFKHMYWSVIGLYGAFVAETMVRIPFLPMFKDDFKPTAMFFNVVGVSVAVVMFIAAVYFRKQKHVWAKKFNPL